MLWRGGRVGHRDQLVRGRRCRRGRRRGCSLPIVIGRKIVALRVLDRELVGGRLRLAASRSATRMKTANQLLAGPPASARPAGRRGSSRSSRSVGLSCREIWTWYFIGAEVEVRALGLGVKGRVLLRCRTPRARSTRTATSRSETRRRMRSRSLDGSCGSRTASRWRACERRRRPSARAPRPRSSSRIELQAAHRLACSLRFIQPREPEALQEAVGRHLGLGLQREAHAGLAGRRRVELVDAERADAVELARPPRLDDLARRARARRSCCRPTGSG